VCAAGTEQSVQGYRTYTRSRIWVGVCKPNVTHVTLSTRYVRERGTWPARDARTVNRNFVRFKTWDWDCGQRTGLGRRGDCPRFPWHSSPHLIIITTCTASLCPCPCPTTPPQSRMKTYHVSYPSRSIKRANVCICYIAVRWWCVAGWRQICALLIWSGNLIHPHLITNSKFGCIVIPVSYKLQHVRFAANRERSPPSLTKSR
jgi:hypothetical protein